MLAVLGFVTILLVLALIMSKKVSTLVALIFVPAITGFIAAFINAPDVIIQAAPFMKAEVREFSSPFFSLRLMASEKRATLAVVN